MAWNTKYEMEFVSHFGNVTHKLQIQEEDFVGSITYLEGGTDPVVITMPDADILKPLAGSGLEISLVSATSLQLLGLYTEDPMHYKIKLIGENSLIIWSGWLNSETYLESYGEYANYYVSFSANDGVALMDRYKYELNNGDPIINIDRAFDVVRGILLSISNDAYLSITDNVFVLDKDGVVIPTTTDFGILHNTHVNTTNYYDELGKAMTFREVLEGILKSLGLMMRYNVIPKGGTQDSLGWYIFDNNFIRRDSSVNILHYSIETGVRSSTTAAAVADYYYDLTTDLSPSTNKTQLSYSDIVNSQTVTYSPYLINKLIDAPLDDSTIPTAVYSYDDHDTCEEDSGKWNERYVNVTDLKKYSMITSSEVVRASTGVYGSANENKNTDFWIKYNIKSNIDGTTFDRWKVEPDMEQLIFGDPDCSNTTFCSWGLLIDFEAYFRLNEATCYSTAEVETSVFTVPVKVIIGSSSFIIQVSMQDTSLDNPDRSSLYKWLRPYSGHGNGNEGFLIKLHSGYIDSEVAGDISLVFQDKISYSAHGEWEMRVKNVKLTLVQDLSPDTNSSSFTEFSDNDKVIESKINVIARNEGSGIDLIHGSLFNTGAIEKGALLTYNSTSGQYFAALKFDKLLLDDGAQPLYFSAEEWIINKVVSNYRDAKIKLSSVEIKANEVDSSVLLRLSDITNLSTKYMFVSGYSFNLYNGLITFNLIEVEKDNMDIINE